jgi:transposase-like protein
VSCKPKERWRGTAASELGYGNNRIESDHRHVKRRLRAMQGPRTIATAWAVIQGIEAAYMIRKGQTLGITRNNLHGQAWLFGSLLGVA